MTIFRHKKTGKLYTIQHLCGGHRYLGKPYLATPYKWAGKPIGGFGKGPSVYLKDFEALYQTNYRTMVQL